MGDKKNIDRLFREKFKHFEAVPDAHVWSAIDKKLGKSKKDRRVFPFILRYGSIAAAIALLITLGYNLNPSNNSVDPQNITNTDTKENTNNNTPAIENTIDGNNADSNSGTIPVRNTLASNNNAADDPDGRNPAALENKEIVMNYPEAGIAENNRSAQGENIIKDNSPVKENEDAVAENKKSLLDAIQEKNSLEEDAVAQNTSNRWSVTPNAAAIYFNSLGDGSPMGDQYSDNTKSGDITSSYGVNVAYQVNDRFSVRSGINRVSFGYNTNNIIYTPAANGDTGKVVVEVSDENTVTTDPQPQTPINGGKPIVREGKLVQEFGYLEVPLEVKYRLSNKKIGVNIIGGVSSLFLTDNKASAQDAFNTPIEPEKLSQLNFSTNIGLGIDYKFSDEIILNMEPMFKYQWNTFSDNSGGFKPYSLGVYTGLSFRF